MNDHGTTCWSCHRPLVCLTDGDGYVIWDCPPCREEIARLQAAARRTAVRRGTQSRRVRLPDARWQQGRQWFERERVSKAEIARRLGVSPQAVDYHERRDGWTRGT